MRENYSIKRAIKILSRFSKKRVVLIGGSFDLLHIGHLRYLNNAKKLGNYLVIALNSDSHIKTYKPSHRPIIPQNQRAEILEGLKPVDVVFITTEGLFDPKIYRLIKPNILALGKEKNRRASRIWDTNKIRQFYPELKVCFVNKGTKNVSSTLIEQKIIRSIKRISNK